MTDVPPDAYLLDRVFAQELSFQSVADVAALPDAFKIEYAWDWEPRDTDTFYVLFGVRGLPGKDRAERVTVSMAALFRREGNPQKPALVDFITTNGPTMLMPYVREAFSNLTGRGLLNSYLLPPVNILVLRKTFKFESSAGARKLADHADLGTAYGIAPEIMAQVVGVSPVNDVVIPGET